MVDPAAESRPPAPQAPPSPARAPGRRRLWLLLVACGLAIAAWAVTNLRRHLIYRAPRLPPAAVGKYCRVANVVAPLSVLLDDGTPALVRPAGVAPPAAPAAQARLVTRLGELLPPGARVYVEMAPKTESKAASEGTPVPASVSPASLWLPPPDADETEPIPYEKARLVAAVLIQEGLARVNLDEPYVYQNEFLLLEDDARRHGRGLWAAEAAP